MGTEQVWSTDLDHAHEHSPYQCSKYHPLSPPPGLDMPPDWNQCLQQQSKSLEEPVKRLQVQSIWTLKIGVLGTIQNGTEATNLLNQLHVFSIYIIRTWSVIRKKSMNSSWNIWNIDICSPHIFLCPAQPIFWLRIHMRLHNQNKSDLLLGVQGKHIKVHFDVDDGVVVAFKYMTPRQYRHHRALCRHQKPLH